MANKRKLTVEIAGDVKGLSSSLDDADKKLGGLGGSLSRVGETAAGFLSANVLQGGLSKLASFADESIEQSTKLGESINAVNKIFGDSAQQIHDWGKSNAVNFGLSTASFNQLSTPLGALLKNQGIANVAGQTIDLTKRAADLASVFNVDVSEAMEAINSGLKGEADPLEKFGVGLSAAKVEAQALADTGKKVAKELTDQEKAQARLNLIMKESASVAGDFTSTSGEFANAQRIAAAKTEELQAKLGAKLVPVMHKVTAIKLALVSALVSHLIPAFEKVGKVIQTVGSFLGDHKELVIAAGIGIMAALVPAFIAWAVAAGTAAVATIAAAAPVIAIGVAVAALAAGIIYAYQHWGAFRTVVDAVARFLRDDLVPTIQRVIDFVVGFGMTVYGIGEQIAATVRGIIGWFKDLYVDIINTFVDISIVAGNIWNGFVGGVKTGVNAVIGAIEWLINRAADGLNKFVGGMDWLAGPFINFSEVGHVSLPRLHSGGMFRAPRPGGEGLAILQDGERVSRPGMSGDGASVVVHVHGSVISAERDLVSIIESARRRGVTV